MNRSEKQIFCSQGKNKGKLSLFLTSLSYYLQLGKVSLTGVFFQLRFSTQNLAN